MKKTFLVLAVLMIFGGVFLYSTESPTADIIPTISEDEPSSTLTCSGPEAEGAMLNIRQAYGEGGDLKGYRLAAGYISLGICQFNTESHLQWWGKDDAFREDLKPYEAVNCQTLPSGQCISVQPVAVLDRLSGEVTWNGYMLLVPRVEAGIVVEVSTKAARLQKGLMLDMNY